MTSRYVLEKIVTIENINYSQDRRTRRATLCTECFVELGCNRVLEPLHYMTEIPGIYYGAIYPTLGTRPGDRISRNFVEACSNPDCKSGKQAVFIIYDKVWWQWEEIV